MSGAALVSHGRGHNRRSIAVIQRHRCNLASGDGLGGNWRLPRTSGETCMTPEALRGTALAQATPPPGLPGPLVALWWDARGDWESAHVAVQSGEDAESAWVHAYLHRKE